jgi:predicted RNase H-like nuclease
MDEGSIRMARRSLVAAREQQGLAGVDGCREGWVVVFQRGRDIEAFLAGTMADLAVRIPAGTVVAIDMPIGLPDRGDRTCCKEARSYLRKPRSCSVFAVPIRACLRASNGEAASRIQERRDGRRLSRQTQSLLPKILEVDTLLRSHSRWQSLVYEVHPEVSFARWAGASMQHNKKRAAGRAEREALIDRQWPGARERCWAALDGDLARDDLNDAFAALWTARRIAAGKGVTMPDEPPLDAEGLPMRIVS